MDITETETEYKVAVEAPGVSKDEISIEFENGVLTISGEKKSSYDEKDEKSYRIERRYGAFTRSLRFRDVENDKITASHKDGVLAVVVPKSEAAQPRKIAVESHINRQFVSIKNGAEAISCSSAPLSFRPCFKVVLNRSPMR